MIRPKDGVATIVVEPVCRSGQCVKLVYTGFDTTSPGVAPCSELAQCQASGFTDIWSIADRMAGGDKRQFYLSFWMRLGADHADGRIPPQYKLARVINDSGDQPSLVLNNLNESEELFFVWDDDRGQHSCSVDVDWDLYVDKWLRIEWAMDFAGDTVKLWVTQADGASLGHSECSIDWGSNVMDRFAYVMANVSGTGWDVECNRWPPCGGDPVRTVYIDDVCVADSELARNLGGACYVAYDDVLDAPKNLRMEPVN
ncbi:MAG: hypothetical protein ACWGQW_22960 [bacterium]